MAYSYKQRSDKGFDFYNDKGKKVLIDEYVQKTGANKNKLVQDLANAGDKVSQADMRIPEQTRTKLYNNDAAIQKSRSSIGSASNILGDLAKAGQNVGKAVGGFATDSIKSLSNRAVDFGDAGAQVIREATGLNQLDFEKNQAQNQDADRTVKILTQNLSRTTDPAARERYIRAININNRLTSDTNDSYNNNVRSAQEALDPRKTITNAAETALDIATAGKGAMLLGGLKNGAEQVTKQSLIQLGKNTAAVGAQGAGVGGAYGAVNTARNEDATLQDYAKNIGTGAALGAAVGVGANVVLPAAGEIIRKAPGTTQTVVKAVNDARPSVIAKSDPRVTGFDDQYQTLAQQFDTLPAGSPERTAVSRAMADNRQARLGAMRSVQREVGQGGYVRLPGEPGTNIPQKSPEQSGNQPQGLKSQPEQFLDNNPGIQTNPTNALSQQALGIPQSSSSKSLTTPTINTNRYNVSDETKQVLKDTVDGLSKNITERTGKKLSLKEVADTADETTAILRTGKTRESTLKATAAMQNARQKQALLADKIRRNEGLTPEEQAEMVRLTVSINTTKTDLARQLGSLRNNANPRAASTIDVVLDKLSKEIGDADAIAKAAKEYDLTDTNQLAEFYRSFIKATPEDWLDKLRYNSMLSSPLTHSRNIFANVSGASVVAPVQKAFEGGVDAVGSIFRGGERTRFAGESGRYATEYLQGLFSQKAREAFKKSMKGELGDVNIDMNELYSLPLATKGFAGATDKILSFTTRLTDAVDQWAMVSVRRGEEAALNYRKSKGVDVGDVGSEAMKAAEYRLFKQQLGDKEQGNVLRALDFIPQKVLEATSVKNPLIRYTAKLTFPFVKTPTNVAKQMIEYSPLGLANLPGAKDKTAVIAKAVMGTAAVATMTGTLAANNALTFSLPSDPKEREKFLAEGKQPYSFKVGDKWVSYQYLHPAISFNMAAVASVNEALRNGDVDEPTATKILEGIAGASRFFVDQSYFKNAQDFLSNLTADSFSNPATMAATWANNVTSQFVPFRALATWVKNMVDPVQRKVDTSQDVFKQFADNFQKNLPGLSQNVGSYTDALGNPLKNTDTLINAISPVRVKTEKPGAAQGEDPLSTEINRMYMVDEGIKLSPLSAKQDFNGVETKLPTDQRKQLEDNINTTTNALWKTITEDPRYGTMSDEDKRKVLSSAKSDVTAAMKDRFAKDFSYGQYALDFAEDQKKLSASESKIANGTIKAGNYLGGTVGDTKLETKSKSYTFLDQMDTMTEQDKKEWSQKEVSPDYKDLVDNINKSLPEGLPKIPATNGVAELYAKFQKDKADKGWSELQTKKETKKLVADSYKSFFTDNERFISGLSDKEILSAADNGEVSKEEIEKIITIDNALNKLGMSQMIGNKTRAALGYGTLSSGSGTSKGSKGMKALEGLSSTTKTTSDTLSKLNSLLSQSYGSNKVSAPQSQKVALRKIEGA